MAGCPVHNAGVLPCFQITCMKKTIVIVLALLYCLSPAFAQGDAATVIAEIQASGKALKSFECDFIQTATNPMMKEAMTSRGRMFYQAPSCVRWEYTEPAGTSMVLNGSKALMSAGGKSQVVDLGSQKNFSQMSSLMTGLVQGSLLADGSFECSVEMSDRSYTVSLSPVSKALKKNISGIVILYDRRSESVSEIEMRGKGEQSVTVIKLINMKKNVAIAADVFKVE